MTIRVYSPADFDTIQAWAGKRGMCLAPQLLSTDGWIVEDESGPLAVAFVYLVFGVPMALVDHLVIRPRASIAKAREAWAMLWNTIQSFLSNLRDGQGTPIRYKFVRNFCRPELARLIKRDGWKVADRPSIQVIYELPSQ